MPSFWVLVSLAGILTIPRLLLFISAMFFHRRWSECSGPSMADLRQSRLRLLWMTAHQRKAEKAKTAPKSSGASVQI